MITKHAFMRHVHENIPTNCLTEGKSCPSLQLYISQMLVMEYTCILIQFQVVHLLLQFVWWKWLHTTGIFYSVWFKRLEFSYNELCRFFLKEKFNSLSCTQRSQIKHWGTHHAEHKGDIILNTFSCVGTGIKRQSNTTIY